MTAKDIENASDEMWDEVDAGNIHISLYFTYINWLEDFPCIPKSLSLVSQARGIENSMWWIGQPMHYFAAVTALHRPEYHSL